MIWGGFTGKGGDESVCRGAVATKLFCAMAEQVMRINKASSVRRMGCLGLNIFQPAIRLFETVFENQFYEWIVKRLSPN
jgi:hypothetical protein